MLINLSDAFTSEGYVAKRQAETELTQISCRMGDFPIIEKTPLALTLTNLGTCRAAQIQVSRLSPKTSSSQVGLTSRQPSTFMTTTSRHGLII